jgi:hypothetical protein
MAGSCHAVAAMIDRLYKGATKRRRDETAGLPAAPMINAATT